MQSKLLVIGGIQKQMGKRIIEVAMIPQIDLMGMNTACRGDASKLGNHPTDIADVFEHGIRLNKTEVSGRERPQILGRLGRWIWGASLRPLGARCNH